MIPVISQTDIDHVTQPIISRLISSHNIFAKIDRNIIQTFILRFSLLRIIQHRHFKLRCNILTLRKLDSDSDWYQVMIVTYPQRILIYLWSDPSLHCYVGIKCRTAAHLQYELSRLLRY